MESFTNGELASPSRAFPGSRGPEGQMRPGGRAAGIPAKGFPGGPGAAEGPGAAGAGVKVSPLPGPAPNLQLRSSAKFGMLARWRGRRQSWQLRWSRGKLSAAAGRSCGPGESLLVRGVWSSRPVLHRAVRVPFRNRAGWGRGWQRDLVHCREGNLPGAGWYCSVWRRCRPALPPVCLLLLRRATKLLFTS